jgi:hypothetical protein
MEAKLASTVFFRSERISRTEEIILNGNISTVFPLFGAFEERKWAEGWNPELIYPETEIIAEGTTFKTEGQDAPGEAGYTWIVDKYDADRMFIQYLVFTVNRYWTIAVECAEINAGKMQAKITYTFTALNEMGHQLNIQHLDRIYADSLKDWESEINAYLSTQAIG